MMNKNPDARIIGEKVKVANEKHPGVVTRIDYQRGLIYVLFKSNKEVPYAYPEDIQKGVLEPIIPVKKD